MSLRLVKDTFIFAQHLFLKVEDDGSLNQLVYLKLQHFEMIEEVLAGFGGLYCKEPVNLKLIIAELQNRLGIFGMLKN